MMPAQASRLDRLTAMRGGLVLAIAVMLQGCVSTRPAWTYLDPPAQDDYLTLNDKFVWCETRQGAQYTALTGWFGPGCHYSHLADLRYRVASLSHEMFGEINVVFVKCVNEQGVIWLPLPSHRWA